MSHATPAPAALTPWRVLLVTPALLAAFFAAYFLARLPGLSVRGAVATAAGLMHLLGIVAAVLAVRVFRASGDVPGRDTIVVALGLLALGLSNWGWVMMYGAIFGTAIPRPLMYLYPVVHVGALGLFIRFAGRFPAPLSGDALPADLGVRLPQRRVGAGPIRGLQRVLLRPWFVAAFVLLGSVFTIAAAEERISWGTDPFETATAVALLLAAFTLRTGYLLADDVGRRRLRWIFLGFVGAGALHAVYLPLELMRNAGMVALPDWSFIPTVLGIGVLLVCLGVAVLYRGDFDPALTIQRTAVITATVSLVLLTLAVLQDLVIDRLADWLDASQTTVGTLLGVLLGYSLRRVEHGVRALFARIFGGEPAPMGVEPGK